MCIGLNLELAICWEKSAFKFVLKKIFIWGGVIPVALKTDDGKCNYRNAEWSQLTIIKYGLYAMKEPWC